MAVTIRRSGLTELVVGPISDFTTDVAARVQRVAHHIAPFDTGRLRRGITRYPKQIRGLHVRIKVGTTSGYGLFPEQGTGIYGPKHKIITPRRKPFLVFQPRGLGHIIRVRSVKGQRGQHYMLKALLTVIAGL
jgi:hypothetical protein